MISRTNSLDTELRTDSLGRPARFSKGALWRLNVGRAAATAFAFLAGIIPWRTARLCVLFLPTLLTACYFFGIAANQYESEARFVVRSATRPEMSGGLAFLVQLGLARSQDDSFVVQDFMTSRDAIARLRSKLPVDTIFSRDGVDVLSRYPSIFYGSQGEEFYKYFQRMVSVIHADKTGISTLRVRAFRGADAQDIAATLLALGEELINRINERQRADAIKDSSAALRDSQARLISAQAALTEFRNRELILDPGQNAVVLAELIARLSAELSATQAQIIEMKISSSATPQIAVLQRKESALGDQIVRERSRIATGADGLAARIAVYERLSLEREFANRVLNAAEAELVRARSEAARKQLYLERVVEPHLADHSTQPKRIRSVLTVFAANALLVLIGWLAYSGVREHGPAKR